MELAIANSHHSPLVFNIQSRPVHSVSDLPLRNSEGMCVSRKLYYVISKVLHTVQFTL